MLAPLAEQLLAAIPAGEGDTVCDLVCDGGVLTRRLAARVQPSGHVYAADRHEVDDVAAGSSVRAVCITGERVGLADASCDCVLSLLGAVFLPGAIAEAQRLLRPGGRLGIVCWDPARPPAHEAVLSEALRALRGRSPFLDTLLSGIDATGLQASALRDVVRFDSIAEHWAALVTERPLQSELSRLTPADLSTVRQACAAALQAYSTRDGTLRIPVQALLLSN